MPGWKEVRIGRHDCQYAGLSGLRMERYNGRAAAWKIVRVSKITISTAGWSGVSMIRHNDQRGRLEGSEEGPA